MIPPQRKRRSKAMKYLKVYTDFAEAMEALSDAERGRLFMSMLQYASTGEAGTLSGAERFVWPIAKQNIDRAQAELEKEPKTGAKAADRKKQTKAGKSNRKQKKAKKSKRKITKTKTKTKRIILSPYPLTGISPLRGSAPQKNALSNPQRTRYAHTAQNAAIT